jgi:hypothetical protein
MLENAAGERKEKVFAAKSSMTWSLISTTLNHIF